MSHECPSCDQMCYCDGEDTYMQDEPLCLHACDDERCEICEDNGCAACLGEEKAGQQISGEDSLRGDRAAIERALVAPLFRRTD